MAIMPRFLFLPILSVHKSGYLQVILVWHIPCFIYFQGRQGREGFVL